MVQDGEVIKTEYWCPNDRYRLCSENPLDFMGNLYILQSLNTYYYYYYLLLHRTASLVIIQCN